MANIGEHLIHYNANISEMFASWKKSSKCLFLLGFRRTFLKCSANIGHKTTRTFLGIYILRIYTQMFAECRGAVS